MNFKITGLLPPAASHEHLTILRRRTAENPVLVKAACEVCGSPLKAGANKIEIDGAIMIVCNNCVKLGRPVSGPIVRDARPNPIHQGGFKPFGAHSAPPAGLSVTPEVDVDPDYNVKIRQAREKLGLSQEELGRMLNEKPSVIRMVESKKLKPDLILTRKFMHYLKVNLLVPLSELEGTNTQI
jgi:putative transcription factor